MEIISWIFILLILIFLFYRMLSGILICYYHYFFPKTSNVNNQNIGFKKKHVKPFAFISWYLDGSESVKLTNYGARMLNDRLDTGYPDILPKTVTILSTLPSFSSYKHFFANCYYTEKAVPFYDYKTQRKTIYKCNQQLFVCFDNSAGRPFEVHMCDQSLFRRILQVYLIVVAFASAIYATIRFIGPIVKTFLIGLKYSCEFFGTILGKIR